MPAQSGPARAREARVAALTGGGAPVQPGPAPERRVTARGALSRDRIIDATLGLLSEGGYAALSISAICKRAQTSPASLYHHFGDKAGLVSATIEEGVRSGARRFAEAISVNERPLDRLEALLQATREVGRDPRTDAIAVLLKAAEALGDAPELSDAIAETRGRVWRFCAAELADLLGVEDGMLFTHLQFAFMTYTAHLAHSSKTKEDARAVFDSYRRILLITMAALRPDFTLDPAFAAAVAEASRPRVDGPETLPQSREGEGR